MGIHRCEHGGVEETLGAFGERGDVDDPVEAGHVGGELVRTDDRAEVGVTASRVTAGSDDLDVERAEHARDLASDRPGPDHERPGA